MSTKDKGFRGELLAEKFLKKQGYKIVDRNFACQFGEIDLIGYRQGVLSFIEVKARSSGEFGQPVEAVTDKKRKKLIKSAEYFNLKHKIPPSVPCRFDIVSIILHDDVPQIDFFPNAFTK